MIRCGKMNYRRRVAAANNKIEDVTSLDGNEGDEKDESKRKMRNLSEKKRRDQFNMLIGELSSMISNTNRKMDKSAVLKSTISFLRSHNETTEKSQAQDIQEDWKPSFLSDEEFTHLMLEALNGFILVFASDGKLLYTSESVAALLGQMPNEVSSMTVGDLIHKENTEELYDILATSRKLGALETATDTRQDCVTFTCYMKREPVNPTEPYSYEFMQCVGCYKHWGRSDSISEAGYATNLSDYCASKGEEQPAFIILARTHAPKLLTEIPLLDATRSEFTSRHSLEWKFLFLDHRASPIIGYLPFEVLGTSGYDYYHADDLDRVAACHEALMQTGEGTSCYFRFLTKGQQWIWLQSRYYITYHQWNSKPEFIVCTHKVISIAEAKMHMRNEQANTDTRTNVSSLSPLVPKFMFTKHESPSLETFSPGATTSIPTSRHSTPNPIAFTPMYNEQKQIKFAARKSGNPNPEQHLSIPDLLAEHDFMKTDDYHTCGSPNSRQEQDRIQSSAISQNEFQEILHRKQQALQELIFKQQEELKKVDEQLAMSQCFISPNKVKEIPIAAAQAGSVTSSAGIPFLRNS